MIFCSYKEIYPEHEWTVWKFKRLPSGYWANLLDDTEEIQKLVSELQIKLKIKDLEDWYRISLEQLKSSFSLSQLSKKDMVVMLKTAYPRHSWDLNRLSGTNIPTRSSQRILAVALRELFPGKSSLV